MTKEKLDLITEELREQLMKYDNDIMKAATLRDYSMKHDAEIELEDWFTKKLEEVERDTAEEIIELSDSIEVANESGIYQWKGFKQLRNTIRDKYCKS